MRVWKEREGERDRGSKVESEGKKKKKVSSSRFSLSLAVLPRRQPLLLLFTYRASGAGPWPWRRGSRRRTGGSTSRGSPSRRGPSRRARLRRERGGWKSEFIFVFIEFFFFFFFVCECRESSFFSFSLLLFPFKRPPPCFRTRHVARVAPVHEPVGEAQRGEELGLAAQEVAEELLEAPRALVSGGEERDFFFFFFFFFFLGKGFRESEREINRTKQTAAPPSVCQRGAYLCLLLSRRSRAQENREEKTSLTRGERREEAEVGRGRFRRRRRRRRRGAADDIGRFRRGPVGHLLRGARNGARGNRPASHHGPVHFQRASRERGAG